MRMHHVLFASLLTACGGTTDEGSDGDDRTGDTEPTAADPCEVLGLDKRAFNSDGQTGTKRRELAADFSFKADGEKWVFSEQWSGCDSYIFITDANETTTENGFENTWAVKEIDRMLGWSPPNVHYFFISLQSDKAAAEANQELIRKAITKGLKKMPDGDEPGSASWWEGRLHVVDRPARDIKDWVGPAAFPNGSGGPTGLGLAIDRFQRVRGMGGQSDVENANNAWAERSGGWPYPNSYAYAANEAVYFNFEYDRNTRLEAEDATIVTAWDGQILEEYDETDVTFPDDLSGFDTLEIDLSAWCPDADVPEQGNCGAWDYLAHIRLQDANDEEKYWEMARFITTYHRAGRYIVDATPMLALIQGGKRHIRYNFAPSWNTQPTLTELHFRLTNQGKGHRPTKLVELWNGGGYNPTYNDNKDDIEVEIPASAKRVELRTIITGHGGDTNNCAEFCDHEHHFTVGTKSFTQEFPDVGDNLACMKRVAEGVIPNQSGTWWFGRGGWCPGQEVDPWIVDVTDEAKPGEKITVKYNATYGGGNPIPENAGNINMSSWIVIYE